MTARRAARPGRLLLFALMVLVAVAMLYPIYYMIRTSLRSEEQYQQGTGASLDSWRTLFEQLPVLTQMRNSAIVCAGALLIILVVSTTAGFAFAKLSFRGGGAVFAAIVGCAMVPLQSLILPEFTNLARIQLVNHYLGAVLVYAALGTPFATFLMTVYFRGLPDELLEAGVMDGLGPGQIFLRIGLPLAWPAMATVVVLQFIQIWCDLLVGLLFLQTPELQTVTTGLGVLASGRVTSVPVLMAGATLSAIPAVLVYLVLQRFFVRGLTAGIAR
jgi:ABC-type glycerol-3-phosphate transport system permease component